jgi:hypothetical protein
MSEQHRRQFRLILTGVVMVAELAHLTWEHFNGGVSSHHILHRSDMPRPKALQRIACAGH